MGCFGGLLIFCFPLWFLAVRCFEGEFVVPFVRFVDDLVEVFCGEFLLGGGCCVCSCMPEVVCGPVCSVDHVGLFVEVFRRGGQCLRPHMLGVQGVIMEIQPLLSPCPNDPAVCIVVDGVFLVVATHRAVAMVFLSESPLGAPSAKDGVPTSEADSWREVFHNALQVAHAPACVDAWPSFQVPESEVCPYFFVHVECGETS